MEDIADNTGEADDSSEEELETVYDDDEENIEENWQQHWFLSVINLFYVLWRFFKSS